MVGTLLSFGAADRTVTRETKAPADGDANRRIPAHMLKACLPICRERRETLLKKSVPDQSMDPTRFRTLKTALSAPKRGQEEHVNSQQRCQSDIPVGKYHNA